MTELNWTYAQSRLDEVTDAYKSLIGMRGVNPMFGLAFLGTLNTRFEKGERTQDLYDEMMECE